MSRILASFVCSIALCLALALGLKTSLCAQTPAGIDGQLAPDASFVDATDSAAVLTGEPGAGPADPKTSQPDQPDPNKLKVVIYPVLGWGPIYGDNLHLPDTPSTPGGGSGSTNTSFNGAALFGFTLQKSKWYGAADVMWAGLSASRTSPLVKSNLNAVYGEGILGYEIYRNLYFTGAFRRIGLDYKVTLGNFPQFQRSPGIWDPLIGLLWNPQLSKKWSLRLGTEGGGFGVGADVDFSASGMADWQFAKHFGATFGWAVLHLSISDTKLGYTFKATPTLNGPTFGFGIYF